MSGWFSKKSRLERLQQKYAELMKKSFKVALKDTKESDKMQQKAYEIYSEIKHLTLQRADK
ncbi:Lacal_2735 family protein [Rasiella rasia]|uniref:Lacal_2735 family protein n=1 Tax=Rasiella rasia TaxID=2744027 RepID=A0A6G6GPT0_9FLAO|nr:Lacal_2735 family protein [Rasiella rasia]QIE60547.1 Lacal_2735 family protein [Rasiella rasia]